jgi:hypothetical protein
MGETRRRGRERIVKTGLLLRGVPWKNDEGIRRGSVASTMTVKPASNTTSPLFCPFRLLLTALSPLAFEGQFPVRQVRLAQIWSVHWKSKRPERMAMVEAAEGMLLNLSTNSCGCVGGGGKKKSEEGRERRGVSVERMGRKTNFSLLPAFPRAHASPHLLL